MLFNTCLMCLPSLKQVIRARGTISSQAIDSLLVILGEKENEDMVLVLLSVLIWTWENQHLFNLYALAGAKTELRNRVVA